jgi:hypothetical protein
MVYQFTTDPCKPYKSGVASATLVAVFTAEMQKSGNTLRVISDSGRLILAALLDSWCPLKCN